MDARGARVRHLKRGSSYTILGEGELQTGTPLNDGQRIVVYQGDDGKIWARSDREFFDGRFELIVPPRAPRGVL